MFYVLFVDADDYESRVIQHNAKQSDPYADSGFDLACPTQLTVEAGTLFIDFKVKAAMYQSDTPLDLKSIPRLLTTCTHDPVFPRRHFAWQTVLASLIAAIAVTLAPTLIVKRDRLRQVSV